MKIIKAKNEDYPEVRRFYHSLIDAMQEGDYPTKWQKDVYPAPESLQAEIGNGSLFLGLEGGRIAAAMAVNRKGNPQYGEAEWGVDAGPEEAAVIHMLGVHPDFAGRGFAKDMVKFAVQTARDAGMKAVRLDVLKGNLPAVKVYESQGFGYITTVSMFYENTGWTAFDLYELEL